MAGDGSSGRLRMAVNIHYASFSAGAPKGRADDALPSPSIPVFFLVAGAWY